ncbi:putative GNAT family acetyltransferase [Mollisia scopiformis]|uniref:Putative GNAT family acetyltransferase n=1 Tax=Mollisia scopiformis TaxID=149040 RepID=A0A194XPJ8_MOLSC|nr:putative GNAT family acetyltransferase [Mollisia scopiformis]KUJ22086.1 putative GNAT family acetyltransferase [Mollisia scopiformis]
MEKQKASKFTIRQPEYPQDLPTIRGLFTAYALSLSIDLSFQNFESELSSLPGKYSSPHGALLIAFLNETVSTEAIGCIAVRPLSSVNNGTDKKVGEMKRLYCTPAARGLGIGRALAEKIIKMAEDLGYDEMRLDTLPSMEGARKLYQSLGFVETEAYYDTPLKGTIFLSKRLSPR